MASPGPCDRPIAMFDSGFGGLTVARAVIDLLPNEDIVYFGDTGRYPYGSRPSDEVREFAIQIATWLVETHTPKMIVVACNTASAVALDTLQDIFDIPVVGVLEPGLRSLLQVTTSGRVGVIGTVGTIASGAYQTAAATSQDVELVCQACPGFVEFVERGDLESDQVRVLAERLLDPIREANVDSLLLGCTHYPFLARTIADVMGPEVVLVSSADETAFEVMRLLEQSRESRSDNFSPMRRFISSGDARSFTDIGTRLLGLQMAEVESHVWSDQ